MKKRRRSSPSRRPSARRWHIPPPLIHGPETLEGGGIPSEWGNELGVGNSHTYQNIPWVIAGGAGHFKTGRYLQYKDQNHNNLLVSVCHAVGIADTTTFGIPELCTGPLNGLTA